MGYSFLQSVGASGAAQDLSSFIEDEKRFAIQNKRLDRQMAMQQKRLDLAEEQHDVLMRKADYETRQMAEHEDWMKTLVPIDQAFPSFKQYPEYGKTAMQYLAKTGALEMTGGAPSISVRNLKRYHQMLGQDTPGLRMHLSSKLSDVTNQIQNLELQAGEMQAKGMKPDDKKFQVLMQQLNDLRKKQVLYTNGLVSVEKRWESEQKMGLVAAKSKADFLRQNKLDELKQKRIQERQLVVQAEKAKGTKAEKIPTPTDFDDFKAEMKKVDPSLSPVQIRQLWSSKDPATAAIDIASRNPMVMLGKANVYDVARKYRDALVKLRGETATEAIELPANIKTTSQAIEWLMNTQSMTKTEAVEWLRQNAK